MADDLALPFDPLRKRESNVTARKPLTKWEFATIYLHQQGLCAKCSAKLEPGKTRDEHLDALHLGGGNELTNRALWCLACTKPKDKADKKLIAKSHRIKGLTGQRKRRAENGSRLKSNPSIASPARSRLSKSYRDEVKAYVESKT